MKQSESLTENRGVSPVIGIILMVAITVILAAVIGSFTLGIGGDIQETPQASLTMEQNLTQNDQLDITHSSGDSLNLKECNITVDGTGIQKLTFGANLAGSTLHDASKTSPESLEPGESITTWAFVNSSGSYDIRIIHTPSGQLIADKTVRFTGV